MSFCKDCFTGVRHEGISEGNIEEIGGIRCYVATPSVNYPKDTVVLFLADVFGIDLENPKLLADDFAKNGFRVIAPDYFNGDPVPASVLSGQPFDFTTWLPHHGPEVSRPPLDKVIAALRAQGVTKIAATGYCFGARYAVDLALENITSTIVISHPSLLQLPQDFEALKTKSNNPLLINSCEFDSYFPVDKQKEADEILGSGSYAPGYERTYWEGCTHGFAVRGNLNDPKVKAGREGVFKATVEWFHKYL